MLFLSPLAWVVGRVGRPLPSAFTTCDSGKANGAGRSPPLVVFADLGQRARFSISGMARSRVSPGRILSVRGADHSLPVATTYWMVSPSIA